MNDIDIGVKMSKKYLKTLLCLLMMGGTFGGVMSNQVQATTKRAKKITVTKKAMFYDPSDGENYHAGHLSKGTKTYIIGFNKIRGKRFALFAGNATCILVANTNYRNKKLNYKVRYYDPTYQKTPVYKKPKKKAIVYKEDHIVLPEGYTVSNLAKGQYKPKWFYDKVGKKGMKINKFTPESKADNQEVDPSHLTLDQQKN